MRLPVHIATILGLVGALGTARAAWDEETFERKSIPVYSIPTPPKGEPAQETLIGEVRPYRIRKDDTLLDLARYYDLGYNEIVDANPGIDPWVPPVGAIILLPTQWVLPCCTYEGLIVNIPEMRLFYFHRSAQDPQTTVIHTFPVGLGRDDWRTPTGKVRIRGKTSTRRRSFPNRFARRTFASAVTRAPSSRAATRRTRSASTASSSRCRCTASTAPTSPGASA